MVSSILIIYKSFSNRSDPQTLTDTTTQSLSKTLVMATKGWLQTPQSSKTGIFGLISLFNGISNFVG